MTSNTTNDSNVTHLNIEQNNQDANQPINWSGQEVIADVLEPYDGHVDSTILDEIVKAIRTYLFVSEDDAVKMTLWNAHANIFGSFKKSPRLIITAGTKDCGKTVSLTILKAMVNNAIADSDTTPASFYTLSQDGNKAFFLDEVDSWIRGEGRGDLMNSLKTGFDRNGSTTRVEMSGGGGRRVMRFRTHSAVALAGIGLDTKLPPPVIDRSHVIRLRKALKGDLSVRFDDRKHLGVFQELGTKLLRWCLDNQQAIAAYDYQGDDPMPEHLINRKADCWEPFFAIASVAGNGWYKKVRYLVMNEPEEVDTSYDIRLLKAIGEIYKWGNTDRRIDPSELAVLLGQWQDADGYRPYAKFHTKGLKDEADTRIKGSDLHNLLKPFGVHSRSFRNHAKEQGRGFVWADLLDAVERHVPPEEEAVTPLRVTQGVGHD